MKQYTINIELTDAEDVALTESTDPEKNNATIFQQFWDGYESGGVTVIGSVRAQVNQWISDKVQSELSKLGSAEAFEKLNA